MAIFGFLRDLVRRFPLQLAGNALVLFLESLLGLVVISSVAPLVDLFLSGANLQQASPLTQRIAAVMRGWGVPMTIGSVAAVFVVVTFLKSAVGVLARHALLRTKYRVLQDLMVGTFDDCLQARWQFFTGSQQGMVLNTFFREMVFVGDAFGAVVQWLASLFKCGCYLALALYVSWQVTVLSLGTALLLTVPLLLLGRVVYRLAQRTTATGNALAIVVQEAFTAAKIILGYGKPQASVRQLDQAFDEHRRVAVKTQTLMAVAPLSYEPLGVLVFIVAVGMAQRVGLPFSETALLLLAWRSCLPLFGDFVAQKNFLSGFLPSYEQVMRIRSAARALRQPSGTRPFEGFREAITVERVSFAYPGHGPALGDITLRIPKGSMVAIVGESGAGKSTLIDLVMGFSQPASGRIAVDGVPLPAFDIVSYRRRIGYVPQDTVLFNRSIRDNLRWAKEEASDEEIRAACRQAHAEEFIERFPHGYDTVVGDRGVRLSGGQCQRIALARAMLRTPQLLILDEATSSLDSQSERLIQQAIEGAAKATTVIVIAHRLSTIVNADHIYVLRQGRLVEEGTYQELMRNEGPFSHMSQLQVLEAVHD